MPISNCFPIYYLRPRGRCRQDTCRPSDQYPLLPPCLRWIFEGGWGPPFLRRRHVTLLRHFLIMPPTFLLFCFLPLKFLLCFININPLPQNICTLSWTQILKKKKIDKVKNIVRYFMVP